ncbi:MAG: hypothetical protein QGH94_03820 [Phycisphaerae bacterium]|jgi:hypothetical protein|nr:hypothetical protein [Phycisphaerae bacterium]
MEFRPVEPKIILINIALIATTAVVWSKVASWWIIAPVALVLLFFALDFLSAMFHVLLVMIPMSIMSPGLVSELGRIRDGQEAGDFAGGLIWGLGKIAIVIVIEFALAILGIWILYKKTTTDDNLTPPGFDKPCENQTESSEKLDDIHP